MITTLVPNQTDPVLDLSHLLQARTKRIATKQKPSIIIASVSHADTCMILESISGIFRFVLMWDTNTPENEDDPDEGAFIDHAFGITCEELDHRAWDESYPFRQGNNWKLEADVCDTFAEFAFTSERGGPVALSVSMDILRAVEGAID